ncbi:DMT family transporter [Cohnella terricola]|nr:DMT family transporter [Cohnella terricola]
MSGILFGLLSAFSFGTADYLAGRASRKTGIFSTLYFMQLVGLIFLTVAMTLAGQWGKLPVDPNAVLSASLWMALDLIGILLLYQGLVSGKASIVAPIASSFSVITVILALASGERIDIGRLTAIVLTFVGVLLTTLVLSSKQKMARPSRKLESGAVWAILAALFLGVAFFGLRYTQQSLGGLATVWIGRLQATILLPIVFACLKKRIGLALPDFKSAGLMVIVGILDAAALVSYNFGLGLANTSIVIAATSLFAVVTFLWGVLLDREKPAWNQWLGTGCTFIGIFIISLLQ